MMQKGLYRHFKGNYYKVLHLAQHSESAETLVIYQALYGNKDIWARPLSMFCEQVKRGGEIVQRFTWCTQQSEVLEVAILDIIDGCEAEFEAAFQRAQEIIAGMSGYISHSLRNCVEQRSRYLLLVEWQTLEDHTVGFLQSEDYQHWRQLLHRYYRPLPQVQHYVPVRQSVDT